MKQYSNDPLSLLLDQCYERILAGENVAACLESCPEHAAVLAPLLETIISVRELRLAPQRDPQVAAQSRANFMVQANLAAAAIRARRRQRGAIGLWWEKFLAGWHELLAGLAGPRPVPVAVTALLILVLLVGALATGAVTTSARAIPGDPLYPIKTAAEQVQWFFAFAPSARARLIQEFSDRRVDEAKAVLDQGRAVDVPLLGQLEAMSEGEWRISGLSVVITEQTFIRGRPTIGALVRGVARAPGDGRLVALYLEPAPVAAGAAMPAATPTSDELAAPESLLLQPAATVLPSPTPSPAPTTAEPTVQPQEITPEPTATPEPTGTPTATATPTPTVSPTPSVTPTLTMTPTARPVVKGRVIGRVKRIDGSRWIIDGTTVYTDGNTQYVGNPRVGSKVDVETVEQPDGSQLALVIVETAPPEAAPEPMQWTGQLTAINGDRWKVGSYWAIVTAETQIIGDPQIGDWVQVSAERRADGEIWATRIEKLGRNFQLDGIIEAMSDSHWRVSGHTIYLDGQTQINGEPAVGRRVQIDGVIQPDGRPVARTIWVIVETPSPTPSASASPARTVTPTRPAPTVTPTGAEPRATPTATSAGTVTPTRPAGTPSATASPAGTVTPTRPARTATPTGAEPRVTPTATSARTVTPTQPAPTASASAPASPTGTVSSAGTVTPTQPAPTATPAGAGPRITPSATSAVKTGG
jgi:hypothetical protein